MCFLVLQVGGQRLRVDKRLKDFIHQQVIDGVLNVSEMRRHTEAYVRNVLFANRRCPSRLNRRYFPVNRDYANLIYRSRIQLSHSLIDEDNLIQKIRQWSESSDDEHFFSDRVLLRLKITCPQWTMMTMSQCAAAEAACCLCINPTGNENFLLNTVRHVCWMLHIRQLVTLFRYFFCVFEPTLIIVLWRHF